MLTSTQRVASLVSLFLWLPGLSAEADELITPRTVQPSEARALSRAFADTAKAMRPSVVRIDIEQAPPVVTLQRRFRTWPEQPLPDFFERRFGLPFPDLREAPVRGTGSGLIFETTGVIVTNRHVVANARKVKVTLADGREFAAKVVGKDARTDVAVLKLETPPRDLVAARLGDSDRCEVGEWMLAIGSPLGMDQTVTAGILSGKGRAGRRIQMSGDRVRLYLQTDAKINPGNSGGPLVNLDGEVVGINTLINAGPGGSYGFAIPINEVRRVAALLIKEGRVAYAYLGVMVGDVEQLLPEQREKLGKGAPARGAFISEVTGGSPADKAGIKAGDIITGLDEQAIEVGADVVDAISSRAIGSRVNVKLVRDGKPKTVAVTLGELPAHEEELAEARSPEALEQRGLTLQTLTPELAAALGVEPTVKGAVVTEVVPASPAATAGLDEGEVIIEVDQKPVASAAEALRALEKTGSHLLRVKSGAGTRFVTLP